MAKLVKQLFDSPEACADYMAQVPSHLQRHSDDWAGNLVECINSLKTGDTTYVADAMALLSKIDDVGIQAPKVRLLAPALAGYMPNVPAFLAGQPYAMFAKAPSELDAPVTPINVYIENQVSAGVKQSQLLKRGIAMLAFVMALEQRRPVDLWVGGAEPNYINGNQDVVNVVFTRIASRPLDIGRACYMLVSNAFARVGLFTVFAGMANNRHSGLWAFGGPMTKGYERKMRDALELAPHDVFIKGGHVVDDLMLNDPVAWVNEQLKRQDQIAEGEDVDNAA